MRKHHSLDYKLSAVKYYINNNVNGSKNSVPIILFFNLDVISSIYFLKATGGFIIKLLLNYYH